MHPVICQFGPVVVHSYGLMVAIAAIVCSFLMAREAKRLSIKSEDVYDFVFWILISGIFGARIFYVLLNLNRFLESPIDILMIQRGGLAWQGSVVAGFLAAVIFIKKAGWSVQIILDFVAPYLALGHAIGRIGCFLNGCCYGRPSAWGVYFPVHGRHLLPTQLYEMVLLVMLFCLLRGLRISLEKIPGQRFALYLILASAIRFGVQFLRADYEPVYSGLGIFQWVSLGFMGLGVLWWFWARRRYE